MAKLARASNQLHSGRQDSDRLDLLCYERVTFGNESIQLSGLLGNPVRSPLLIFTPGRACRLLDELSDVVAEDCDTVFKFRKRQIAVHEHAPWARCGSPEPSASAAGFPPDECG
jgi:hypothetical protein